MRHFAVTDNAPLRSIEHAPDRSGDGNTEAAT